jgi:hypothetical protein
MVPTKHGDGLRGRQERRFHEPVPALRVFHRINRGELPLAPARFFAVVAVLPFVQPFLGQRFHIGG